ncbi:hypothetical protein HGRIS_002504 [Hohenbuehelia grisea]|uniref:Uncharacterized protein n=1 Tax=Hohenbuehelia grisea TaxID=104357 RepID=A0ABR3JKN6_9AGAR
MIDDVDHSAGLPCLTIADSESCFRGYSDSSQLLSSMQLSMLLPNLCATEPKLHLPEAAVQESISPSQDREPVLSTIYAGGCCRQGRHLVIEDRVVQPRNGFDQRFRRPPRLSRSACYSLKHLAVSQVLSQFLGNMRDSASSVLHKVRPLAWTCSDVIAWSLRPSHGSCAT